jgi:hypothetical protein
MALRPGTYRPAPGDDEDLARHIAVVACRVVLGKQDLGPLGAIQEPFEVTGLFDCTGPKLVCDVQVTGTHRDLHGSNSFTIRAFEK